MSQDAADIRPVARTAEAEVVVRPSPFRRISWGAIFAGLFLVLAVQLMLGLLGFAIGLNLVNPQGGTPDFQTIGIEAAAWWFGTYLVSLFVGGYSAARLSGVPRRFDGGLHGLVTWAFAVAVVLLLLTTAVGNIIGGAFGLVGNALSAAGQGLKMVPEAGKAAGITPQDVQGLVQDLLRPTNVSNLSPEQARDALGAELRRYLAGGNDAQQARDRMIDIVAAQLGISRDDATQRVQQLQSRLDQLKSNVAQTAKQAAGTATEVLSQASLWAFVALLLGAIVSALGGLLGAQRRTAFEVARQAV